MTAEWCTEVLLEAVKNHGKPEILCFRNNLMQMNKPNLKDSKQISLQLNYYECNLLYSKKNIS